MFKKYSQPRKTMLQRSRIFEIYRKLSLEYISFMLPLKSTNCSAFLRIEKLIRIFKSCAAHITLTYTTK